MAVKADGGGVKPPEYKKPGDIEKWLPEAGGDLPPLPSRGGSRRGPSPRGGSHRAPTSPPVMGMPEIEASQAMGKWLPTPPAAGYDYELDPIEAKQALEPLPSGIERTRMSLYDLVDLPLLVAERLGMDTSGIRAGGRTRIDELLEDPKEGMWRAMGAAVYGAVWRWGAEVMYQLPKGPERLYWLANRRAKDVEAGLGGDPFEDLMRIAVSPTGRMEADSVLETDINKLMGYLQEGEIGYTFTRHPERLEAFRSDIAAGEAMEEVIPRYEDFWLEMGLNSFIDPAWFIPAQAMNIIWPGGTVLAKGLGKVAGALGSALKKLKPVQWLTRFTERSLMQMKGGAATDAVTELILRSPADESAIDLLNRALSGEVQPESLGQVSQEALEHLADLRVANIQELFDRYHPDLDWGIVEGFINDNPLYLAHLIGQATEAQVAHDLGYVAMSKRGGLARAYDFAKGLLKEQWLSINPAYMLANATDNTSKCWLMGHFINPFDVGAPTKIAQYLGDYGTYLPARVGESMILEEFGEAVGSRTRRIPVPGIGKPTEIIDFWSQFGGRDLRNVYPWLDGLAPKRPSQVAITLGLMEPPSRMARFLDSANYAQMTEVGRGISGQIEQSARAQLFWDVFSKEMIEARPTLISSAQGMGLSDEVLAGLRRVKNPKDILALGDGLLDDVVPMVRFSALRPEGGDAAMLDYVARALDDLQTDALKTNKMEGLQGQIDELFAALSERATLTQDAGIAEEVIVQWKARQIRESVEGLLGRTRGVSDDLLMNVRSKIAEQPDLARSLWPRYFDSKRTLNEDVFQEISRLVRQRTPNISEAVDGLLGKYEAAAPETLADGLSAVDWGVFGEQLAMLRGGVDEAQELAWRAFLDGDQTPQRLAVIEGAYEQITALWRATAGEASVWRKGYLESERKITPERYQARMTEIWTQQGFNPVEEAWNAVQKALAPVEGEAASAALRAGAQADEAVLAQFRQVQQQDPDAALQWFTKQTEEVQLALQQDAQAEFVEELGTQYALRMHNQARELMQTVAQWRSGIRENLGAVLQTRAVDVNEHSELMQHLKKLARQWAGSLDGASTKGQLEVGKLLFDYSRTQVWEQGLSHFFPFTKWQLRNPFCWRRIMEQQPGAFSLLTRYVRASEMEREQLGLSTRFKGMMSLPGQEWLQGKGVLPEGHWAMDPRALMSAATQLREPFMTPEEEEMGPLSKALRVPEYAGIHMYPWLRQAGAAAGIASPTSWGASGAAGRVFPEVQEAELAIQAQFPGGAPDSQWLKEYWMQQWLTAQLAEGQISALEAADPSPEMMQEAESYVTEMNAKLSTARWLQPFGLKHARPGEMDVRDLRSELREMPEERAAFLRSQHPEVGAYSRAVGSISAPESSEWGKKRDAINAKYDEMLEGLSPWHPRYKALDAQRWEEIDKLGDRPGDAWEAEGVAKLVQERPRPDDFEKLGEVDWEAYNAALEDYIGIVEEAGFTEEEYDQYRQKYLSPLELIWDMQKSQQAEGWDEYERLRGMRRGRAEERTGEGWGLQGGMGEGGTELTEWIWSEVNRRLQAGWEMPDVMAWIKEQDRLPYEEVQRLLEGYGPKQVGEYLPDLLEARPWLEEGARPEEWGGLDSWLDVEMPGMFTPDTEAQAQVQEFKSWYYDLMPEQRRQAEGEMGFDEDMELQEWLNMSQSLDPKLAKELYAAFKPVTPEVRLQVEQDMARYHRGAGEWTELLELYYTDPTSPKSQFWTGLNELILSADAYDDPMLTAVLSGDVRDRLQYSDKQWEEFVTYLEENQDTLVNQEAMALVEQHPDWWELAKDEAGTVRGTSGPEGLQELYGTLASGAERAEWREANPEAWAELTAHWDERNAVLVQNPHYLFFHKHDKFVEWFGDVDPGSIDIETELASYEQANAEMEAYQETGGRWSKGMERWFGGGDNAAADFWDYYFANKNYFSDEVYDDDLVGAALSKDVRDLLSDESKEPIFEEALKKLRSYYNPEEATRWRQYPELQPQAQAEKKEFLITFIYDEKPEDDKQWWKDRKAWQQAHPVMVWFFYYDKFVQWWGESHPVDIGTAPPPPSSGGGGGGKPSGKPSGGPPPPPPPPPELGSVPGNSWLT